MAHILHGRNDGENNEVAHGSRPLKKECATACLQAVLLLLGKSTACKQAHEFTSRRRPMRKLLLGKSTACKQAVALIVDKMALFQRAGG
jgi:hypothetical protein